MVFRSHARLTPEALSPAAALAFVADASAGGTVLFTGTVRDHADGREVASLEYEAYAEVAQPRMEELAAEAHRRWPALAAAWLEHRVGALEIGEAAVVVAASAPHRDDAFAAARWLIDTLKETVPIWKRELWADGGAHWPGTPDPVGGTVAGD
ncbi:MAG TPA: molybdenum cofactor biosynthesis protein MoaE [Egibacteraceae bacterium]|nr:molybdenum cofactor biosynthesis protein MoaE [Egibacteraceae bacterium]